MASGKIEVNIKDVDEVKEIIRQRNLLAHAVTGAGADNVPPGAYALAESIQSGIPIADEPAPDPTEREALASELIAWAAGDRRAVHSWAYEIEQCAFCEEREDWDEEIRHAPDCLHEWAKRVMGGDDEN